MVEQVVLQAERRGQTGTRAARRLRAAARVPAIIYGHGEEPVPVAVNYHDLALELQRHHRLLAVELEGRVEQVLVKDVQYDHLYAKIVHVDLTRVSLDERVKVSVRVELKGVPAGATEGGVLEQVLAAVELECLVTSIPESIRAAVTHLQVGDMLTAGQLELPAGAELLTAPETPVALVSKMAEEEEVVAPAAAPVGGEAAEPEVIKKERAAGEEEGEAEKA